MSYVYDYCRTFLSYSRSQICSNDKKYTFYVDVRLKNKYNKQIIVIFIKVIINMSIIQDHDKSSLHICLKYKLTNCSPRWIVVGGGWHGCAADDTIDLLLRGWSGRCSSGSGGRSRLRCMPLLVLLPCHSQQSLHSFSTCLQTFTRDWIHFCNKQYSRQS